MTKTIAASAILIFLFAGNQQALSWGQGAATIEGAVYDIHNAVIVRVWISIENTETRDLRSVQTDAEGRYRASVPQGRYSVAIRPFPGYPLGYQHSSFSLASGERVLINFRPQPPYAISDSIEGGRWSEKYEGPLLTHATHFIQQPSGAIKDLRVQCSRLRTRGETFEYKYWVIASFDRLTLYAQQALFDQKTARLLAEKNVIFEDGKEVHRAGRIEVNLLTGSATVLEAANK